MSSVKFILITISLMVTIVFSQNTEKYGYKYIQGVNEYVEGYLLVELSQNYVDFPLEVYAAYISFDSSDMTIDSVIYQEFKTNKNKYCRIKKKEYAVKLENIDKYKSGISKRINVNFSTEIIELFKKYGVFYFERSYKTFSPQDTIPHYRTYPKNRTRKRKGYSKKEETIPVTEETNKKTILVKEKNANRSLIIKFNNKMDAKTFVKELKKVNGIEDAQVNEIVQ